MDGLRQTKTVGGVEHRYVWQGNKLVSEYWGGKELEFFYDESGMPYAFSYKSSASATPVFYYYVTNLQGDVVKILNASGTVVANYSYNAWGKLLSSSGTMASVNPIRYRGYYFDAETGFYYVSSRYYDPEICRFINADDASYLGASGDFISYNLFAYCGNNPVTGYDPDGTLDWGNLFKGSGWLAVGVTAIAVGVSVLTCGVAAPAMMAVAAVTVAAGAATVVNGVSELGEVATGHNFMRDDVFRGNANAYNTYAHTTAAVAEIGTMVCGGWLKANRTRIADHKLEQIINNPESVKNYSPQQFQKIANQSSWESGVSANGKGFRAYSGNYSIRYNMNGTRLDAMHFGGNPYWVVSSAAKGSVKIPF